VLPHSKPPDPPDPARHFEPTLFDDSVVASASSSPPPVYASLDRDNWQLNRKAFQHLEFAFAPPHVDLFATQDNKQVKLFCSTCPGDRNHPDLLAIDAFSLVWSGDSLYYANPPFSAIPTIVTKMQSDLTKQLLLIAPVKAFRAMLWPHLINNPVVLDTIPTANLFLPPDRQGTSTGVGPPPWGDTAAFLLSGEPRRVADFRKHFVPKLCCLSDRISGSAKAGITLTEVVARAQIFAAALRKQSEPTTDPAAPLPKFATLAAALQGRWDDIKAAAGDSAFRKYSLPLYKDALLDQPRVPTTPTFTWVTINGFNVIAMLDSGAGISIISWQPELAHVFQKASFRPLPEPRTISGVGTSVARKYVKPIICFRGVAGQYVSVQPTFLVATLSVPLILIGQDVLKGAQILITPKPAFALSLTCPEVVFPCCNTATAIPRTHICYLEETING
jgi:hypothetical protein